MRIPKMNNSNRVVAQTAFTFFAGTALGLLYLSEPTKIKKPIKYVAMCGLTGLMVPFIGSAIDIHKEGNTLKVNVDTTYDNPPISE